MRSSFIIKLAILLTVCAPAFARAESRPTPDVCAAVLPCENDGSVTPGFGGQPGDICYERYLSQCQQLVVGKSCNVEIADKEDKIANLQKQVQKLKRRISRSR